MKKWQSEGLDFIIDKLTNSIENTLTGEVFDTEVVRLGLNDSAQIKPKDWQFDWVEELRDKTKEVYRLTTVNNPTIIQGLLSIEDKKDHIFMHLIESAKFNKGKEKVYYGVPGNLIAFACNSQLTRVLKVLSLSTQNLPSLSTMNIKHYEETLHATHFRGLRMFIETNAATKLISRYFKC
ncbi:hypothetical protein [Dyadobacter bucti]|uniref:hypothetical protein n=1 Tax=Dyadobacter bucti TaxID=2572203 RepID=UPI001109DB2B|nr:hypothetical protein [Dyadobacter bucti]